MDEQAWQAWRSQGVGASDVARAMGAYGWTPARVVNDKLHPEPVNDFQQRLFDAGHRAESGILAGVQREYAGLLTGQQSAWQHPDRPHCRCTLDGILVADEWAPLRSGIVVEAKWTRSANPGWSHYRVQVQYQLAVTGMSSGVIGVQRQGETHVTTELVVADLDQQERLLTLADNLWEAIVAHRAALTGSEPICGPRPDRHPNCW